jgi:hypothetical protein
MFFFSAAHLGKRLAYLNDPAVRSSSRNITYLPEARRTVVVMPFLGGAMGAGHSKLNNRYVLTMSHELSLE